MSPVGNNNKDEDNSPKTPNDKNHQASSQKFRHGKSMLYTNMEKNWKTLFTST